MRSEEEVYTKLSELRARLLSERKSEFLGKTHINCVHNVRFRVKGHGKCGFCRNPNVLKKFGGGPLVCDEEGTAKGCVHFNCRNTPESVEQDFIEIMSSPARCGNIYPKLAILIWFLQDVVKIKRNERFKNSLREFGRSLISLITLRWW